MSVGMISLMMTGCLSSLNLGGSRVVFVDSDSELVRLGPDVEGHIYYFDEGEWVKSKNKVKLTVSRPHFFLKSLLKFINNM